jgi:hypothetical protein
MIFFQRSHPGKALIGPVATGILLSIVTTAFMAVVFIPLIHAPLPPPDSFQGTFGNRVIVLAVRTNEISTWSPEARDLLVKGLSTASRDNRFAEAIPYYDQALAIDPGFTEAWMAKGVALHNLGSYEEALDCIDHALALDPGDPTAWSLKGSILESAGRAGEAATCHEKARDMYAGNDPGVLSGPGG